MARPAPPLPPRRVADGWVNAVNAAVIGAWVRRGESRAAFINFNGPARRTERASSSPKFRELGGWGRGSASSFNRLMSITADICWGREFATDGKRSRRHQVRRRILPLARQPLGAARSLERCRSPRSCRGALNVLLLSASQWQRLS